MSDAPKGPVLFDLDEDAPGPDKAPPVPDAEPQQAAMQRAAVLAARRGSVLGRWFWRLFGALVAFLAGLAAWDFVISLLDRSPVLGAVAFGLIALVCLVLLAIAVKELVAFARLRRVDRLQHLAVEALADGSLPRAREVLAGLQRLYAGRADTAWGRKELDARAAEVLDADGLLGLAEHALLRDLDARALAEIEAAARQVATVTALVPLALADVVTALAANLRMIRRIAEIYGGRSGTLGSWRLTRTVFAHLVATGAVAVGDDVIGSVAGGGMLSRVSRRFGEGVINGALTARVGVAALEVCRPLPFHAAPRPSVTALLRRALAGLFGTRAAD
ncbi:MAG: putative membrane protein [Rhodobacteraceae bacterium HLUCCA08]|nr:MAG: putative membrane protein [Rhodobacteraceae bacterium HLUCCA08]